MVFSFSSQKSILLYKADLFVYLIGVFRHGLHTYIPKHNFEYRVMDTSSSDDLKYLGLMRHNLDDNNISTDNGICFGI